MADDPLLNDPFLSHKANTANKSGWSAPQQKVAQKPSQKPPPGRDASRRDAPQQQSVAEEAGRRDDSGRRASKKKSPGPSVFQMMRLALFYFLFTALLFMLFWQLYKPLAIFAALFQLSFVVMHDPFRANLYSRKGRGVGFDSGFLPTLAGDSDHEAMHIWLRIVIAWLGVLMGSVCGMNAEEKYMSHYFVIEFGSEYENALASTPGAAYIDAGSMNFASSSDIDPAQSVGFKHGVNFCAAPYIDKNQGRKSVAYWAIGYDCCDARGGFDCGDAASNKGARAPPDGLFYHDTGYFMSAVKQAAAVNDLELDDDIVLLYRTSDPSARKVSKFFTALGAVLLGAAIFGLLAFGIIITTLVVSEWEE